MHLRLSRRSPAPDRGPAHGQSGLARRDLPLRHGDLLHRVRRGVPPGRQGHRDRTHGRDLDPPRGLHGLRVLRPRLPHGAPEPPPGGPPACPARGATPSSRCAVGEHAPALSIQGLTKRFGSFEAVSDLSLPSGPVRSTPSSAPTARARPRPSRASSDSCSPSRAESRVCGAPVEPDGLAFRRLLGYVADRPFLYEKLTAWEFLEFLAGVHGLRGWEGEADRVPRPLQARRVEAPAHRGVLPRHEAEAGPDGRPPPPAQAPARGRAHGGPGPPLRQGREGPLRAPGRGGHGALPLHTLPRHRSPGGRPHRHPEPGQPRGGGHLRPPPGALQPAREHAGGGLPQAHRGGRRAGPGAGRGPP